MNDKYFFSKKVKGDLYDVKQKTEEVFKEQGFGLITEIPMHEKLSEKLDNVDVKPYFIMGFCNPAYAYKTMQEEENIGLFLPCKVLVKDLGDSYVEVVAINPFKSMQVVGNDKLHPTIQEVTNRFRKAIEAMPEEL